MGLRQNVQRDLMSSALPDDLKEAFHNLSQWAHTLPEKFGGRVNVHLVDAVSIEGFFKSLVRGVGRYPAFIVDGERYVGSDFSQVDALITKHLTASPKGA